MDVDAIPLDLRVRQEAQAQVEKYQWQLVEADQTAQRVLQLISQGENYSGEYGITNLCERAASEQLYNACIQAELYNATPATTRLWDMAYGDIWRFLTELARISRHAPAPGTDWPEVVQAALLEIRTRFPLLRSPQTVLSYAAYILERKRQQTFKAPSGPGTVSWDQIKDNRSVDPEGDQELFQILGQCLSDDHELIIISMKVLGLKPREIKAIFPSLRDRHKYDAATRRMKAGLLKCASFIEWARQHSSMFNGDDSPSPIILH